MDTPAPPTSVLTRLNAIFLPICAALVIAANYVPFRLLLRVRKVAPCTLVIVLSILNTFTVVNAILWPNNNTAEWWNGVGYCDVQATVRTPLNTLLASCAAYLSLDLANALNTDKPRLHETRKSRRRRIVIEMLFCFTIPILQTSLNYVVEANRFVVVTVYGCATYMDNSWPSIVILSMWPPIFALANCYFAVLVIVRLRRHRGVLSNTLSSTGSGLSARRFLKLFFLSGSILAVYLPVTLYFFYLNLDFQYVPYSWSRVHDPTVWYQIIFLTTDLSPRTQYTGWVGVGMACVLIFLYGFGSGGKEIYKRWLVSCGLRKIFPSLLESRELPMHRRGSSSRSNQASRFDLVSKAIHYYDGVRKGSHAPICSDTTTLRNGSGATFNHANSPSGKSASTSTTADLGSASLPSTSSHPIMTPALVVTRPEPVHPAPLFTSLFRTHTNLPYILFAPRNSSSLTESVNAAPQDRDRNTAASLTTPSSVETTIWSNIESDEDLDPLTPRIGTRAYRERQRRLHEQRDMHLGVLPDTVTVDFGTSHTTKDEIRVERKMEMIEEGTLRFSP